MPSLADTQQLLWHLIAAPEGVARALEELSSTERLLAGGLQSVVRSDERMGAVERLDVYANMYFYRLLDCLKEDYPAVAAVIGEERFHNLTTDYLLAHPSDHPSVRFVGGHLPAFVASHELLAGRADLADLATLERAHLDAFDAPDAAPIAAQRLSALPPDEWAELRFRLTPSLRVLELRFAVLGVRDAVDRGAEPPAVSEQPGAVRVWRRDHRVRHREMNVAEARALSLVASGDAFAAVCESVAAHAGAEHAAAEAAALVARWIADGLIVELG
ncbi:MAG: hypothetical protein QOD06_1031 [Candidatus Binatota bacterium]|jgi:hypothetical protein|nr:hypothetical protein [Candidatus Binatota bacterium]